MLAELHIENFGVIESATIVLKDGLSALTGETGAGKTMVVEAINLLMGQRADASVVRPGADELRVEGRFVVADGTERVLCRVVPRDTAHVRCHQQIQTCLRHATHRPLVALPMCQHVGPLTS